MNYKDIPAIQALRRIYDQQLGKPSSGKVEQFCVYAFLEPDTYSVRYVGQTSCLHNRLICHFHAAKKISGRRLYDWMRPFVQSGILPPVTILQTCFSKGTAEESEDFWIKHHLSMGCDLLNDELRRESIRPRNRRVGPKQEKPRSWRYSDSSRERMSNKYRKFSDQQIEELKALRPEHSYREISEMYGVGTVTVFNAIKGNYYGKSKGRYHGRD